MVWLEAWLDVPWKIAEKLRVYWHKYIFDISMSGYMLPCFLNLNRLFNYFN